jgi:hypothetical protein
LAPQDRKSTSTWISAVTLRILQNSTLRQGDTARAVVVIGGDARIEGHVTQDVVVVLGKAELASTAVVDGSFVAVAGTVEIAEGAKVGRDFVVVGDANVPASFSPGGEHVSIGIAGLGGSLRSLVPWLTHGLLLGRPIVPWLEWVWIVAAIFFFINLCVNLMFDGPVRACTATLRSTPLSAFMAGLLVLLLAGPICLLLVVSVIGIAVIPFLLCAIVVAAIVGRVAFARWIGMTLVHQGDPADRASSTRSFLIGSAIMCITYMVPVIGFMVWALAGVFGLGAATLAFHNAYRRENPKPPKKAPIEPPAPIAPPDNGSYVEPAAASALATDTMPPAALPPPQQPPPPAAASASDLLLYPKASFTERLAALAIDAIAIGIIAQLLGSAGYQRAAHRTARARVSRGLLDMAGDDAGRHDLPAARHPHGRQAAGVPGVAGARPDGDHLAGPRGTGLPLDPARSRAPGLA